PAGSYTRPRRAPLRDLPRAVLRGAEPGGLRVPPRRALRGLRRLARRRRAPRRARQDRPRDARDRDVRVARPRRRRRVAAPSRRGRRDRPLRRDAAPAPARQAPPLVDLRSRLGAPQRPTVPPLRRLLPRALWRRGVVLLHRAAALAHSLSPRGRAAA